MWLINWLVSRVTRVYGVLDTWYWKGKDVAYYWYVRVRELTQYWHGRIRELTQYWHGRIRELTQYWYGRIREIAFYWRDRIRELTQFWYDRIRDLVTLAPIMLSFFTASFFRELLAFLSNPGVWIWAYIIGMAEEKLEELFNKYW